MKSIYENQDRRPFRIVVLTESELSELIKNAVGMALSDPEIQETARWYGMDLARTPAKLSRQAAAKYLNVSVSTLDRVARNHPDLVPRHRDGDGRPYFLAGDLNKYLTYRGYPVPGND